MSDIQLPEEVEKVDLDNFLYDRFNKKKICVEGIIIRAREMMIDRGLKINCPSENCIENIFWNDRFWEVIDKEKWEDRDLRCKKCNRAFSENEILEGSIISSAGILVTIISGKRLPDERTRKINVFIPRSKIEGSEELDNLHVITKILEEFGKRIEVEGYYTYNRIVEKGKVKGIEHWLMTEKIKKADVVKVELSEDEKNRWKGYLPSIPKFLIPKIQGYEWEKKTALKNLITPLEIGTGKKKFVSNGRIISIGDEGTGKSEFHEEFAKQVGVDAVSVELATKVGLTGAVRREGDEFVIDWGLLPYFNKQAIFIKGLHKFDKDNLSSLREALETGHITIIKAVKGQQECLERWFAECNARKHIKKYPTKYQATYDIGIGSKWEEENILSGPDRRRWWIFFVFSEYDEERLREIGEHQVEIITEEEERVESKQFDELLPRFVSWAWSRESKDYDFSVIRNFKNRINEIFNEWTRKYGKVDLAIFGASRYNIFWGYAYANAILNIRLNENNNIFINEEDITETKEMFEEMFRKLELGKYVSVNKAYDIIAMAVANSVLSSGTFYADLIDLKVKEPDLTKDKVCERLRCNESTLNQRLKEPFQVILKGQVLSYSLQGGFGVEEYKIPPVFDERFKITDFGQKVWDAMEDEKRKRIESFQILMSTHSDSEKGNL